MPLNATDAANLANIINDLNPYFDKHITNWQMDIDTAVVPGGGPPTPQNIQLEVDDHYAGEWSFAGQPQKIARALRIRYRYQVRAPSGNAYWVEDYLLIGYEGSGAG